MYSGAGQNLLQKALNAEPRDLDFLLQAIESRSLHSIQTPIPWLQPEKTQEKINVREETLLRMVGVQSLS